MLLPTDTVFVYIEHDIMGILFRGLAHLPPEAPKHLATTTHLVVCLPMYLPNCSSIRLELCLIVELEARLVYHSHGDSLPTYLQFSEKLLARRIALYLLIASAHSHPFREAESQILAAGQTLLVHPDQVDQDSTPYRLAAGSSVGESAQNPAVDRPEAGKACRLAVGRR